MPLKHVFANLDLLDKNQLAECQELKDASESSFKSKTVMDYFKKQLLLKYESNNDFKTIYGSAFVRFSLRNLTHNLFNQYGVKGQPKNLKRIAACINSFLGDFDVEKGNDYKVIKPLDNMSLLEYLSKDVCPHETFLKLKKDYDKHVISFVNSKS